eukprot:177025-Amphidinium_carterae.1
MAREAHRRRAHFADLLHGSSILPDICADGSSYIEIKTSNTKTSSSVKRKNDILSLVAPARGVSHDPWAQAWHRELGHGSLLEHATPIWRRMVVGYPGCPLSRRQLVSFALSCAIVVAVFRAV